MGIGILRYCVFILFLAGGLGHSKAADPIAPTEFNDVFFAERKVSADHLVVGVVAKERRRSVPQRPKAILLREPAKAIPGDLCGEVRSLDGLYFGEMKYPPLSSEQQAGPQLLGYPSERDQVFGYDKSDIAVRLKGCGDNSKTPTFRAASWLGLDRDDFQGAQILLNTQSGTDVFAYIGGHQLTCTPEQEDTRQEVDYRCDIDLKHIDPATPVSVIIDRSGSRDPVVQFYVSR